MSTKLRPIFSGLLWILIQLQIHIWVVHFGLNFHCIDIMSTLCYLWNSTFCPITLFLVVRFEKFLHKQGLFFPDDHFECNNPVLSLKLNILSHISVYLNIICSVYISHIFCYSSAVMTALNGNLELTVLCRLRDDMSLFLEVTIVLYRNIYQYNMPIISI